MKRWLAFAAILLSAACSPAAAADNSAAQQLLDSAHGPANLFQSASDPFDLEVDFTIRFESPMQGHLSLQWQSKDHWRSKVTYGAVHLIEIHDGEQQYTWGSANFVPHRVSQLYELLHLYPATTVTLTATRLKNRTVKGVTLSCITARQEDAFHTKREICLDPATHDTLNEKKVTKFGKTVNIYSYYFGFAGQSFPRNFELDDVGGTITAHVVSLQQEAFRGDLLVPAPEAAHLRVCSDEVPPKPIYTPDPRPGRDFNSDGIKTAKATLHATVLADGSVTDIQVIFSDNDSFTAASIASMKTWKFKPAICAHEPVDADIVIEMRDQKY